MWHYISKSGVSILMGPYLDAHVFSEGLAWVRLADGYTFIDVAGTLQCSSRFPQASEFRSGRAMMARQGCYGFLDREGQWIIEPAYRLAYSFEEDLALVSTGRVHQFIDLSGQVVLELKANMVNPYRCGLALVWRGKDVWYIDKAGEQILGPFDYGEDFSEGLALVTRGGQEFFIDTDGVRRLGQTFDNMSMYCKNDRIGFRSGDKHGFVDSAGRVVIDPVFEDVSDFYDGIAVVRQEDCSGVIDTDGNILFMDRFEFLDISVYGEGLLGFGRDGGLRGYLDTSGRVVVAPRFTLVRPFSEGLGAVEERK